MFSKDREKGCVISTVLTSVLMMGGISMAEEEMVANSATAFGLQAKVQAVLTKQIDYEAPTTLAEHIAQQEFDEMLVDTANIGCEKKERETNLTVNLPQNH